MVLEGVVQNGMIVLKNGPSLPDGTRVKVEIPNSQKEIESNFFQSQSLDELAAAQGILAPCSFDDLLGGWPEEETNDHFEDAVATWRKEEMRSRDF